MADVTNQMPSTQAINLEQKLAQFFDYWSPKVIAEMNENQIKLVKFQGDFVWHNHPETDEVFLVIKGEMAIDLPEQTVNLAAGEMFVIPKGVRHCTRAAQECQAMLIEPRGVVNTGEVEGSELTAANDMWI
jgi:mannose-6-phosphate isomerase-like protein (cupin superfamily)